LSPLAAILFVATFFASKITKYFVLHKLSLDFVERGEDNAIQPIQPPLPLRGISPRGEKDQQILERFQIPKLFESIKNPTTLAARGQTGKGANLSLFGGV
jgi:hypothetical protein